MTVSSLSDIVQTGVGVVTVDDWGSAGAGRVDFPDGRLEIPGALPGERLRVSLLETDGDVARARIIDVLDEAEARRDPLCERDDVCLGCRLRHAAPPEELAYKRHRIASAISEGLGTPVDQLPEVETVSVRPFRRGDAFRIRTRLNYRSTDHGFELGLSTPVADPLVPMTDCPALTTAAQRLVEYVQTALETCEPTPPAPTDESPGPALRYIEVASPTFGRGLVDVVAGNESDAAAVAADSSLTPFVDDLADRLPEDIGVTVRTKRNRTTVAPPERISLPLSGLTIEAGFGDWFPSTIAPTERLYDDVLERLDLGPADRFLDVGCGVGTLALLAADTVEHTVGIDRDARSIEAAELNAVRNDLASVSFRPSGWEKALRQLALDDQSFSAATLHSPGSTVGERPLAYLSSLGIERMVYLSPSPTDGARDIATLQGKGWHVESLAAANLYPHTADATLVAHLTE